MGSKFFSQVLAVGLALVLQAPAVLADPVVSGTTGYGVADGTATATMTVEFLDQAVDVKQIAAWGFYLNWGTAPLYLNTTLSTMSIGGATGISLDDLLSTTLLSTDTSLPTVVTQNDTGYSFIWVDLSFIGIDLSGDIVFTGVFDILKRAVAGAEYDITFSNDAGYLSSFADANINEFFYSTVSTSEAPMRITVLASTPNQIPEPGTLSLLGMAMAGSALVAARKRRQTLG